MRPVLGVEGGGSHSHAVVADMSGEILGLGMNDDAANWEDVGIGAASSAIRSCVVEALEGGGVEAPAITASVFGLAGVDFPIDEERLSGIPLALGLLGPTTLVNDAFVALRAGTDRPFGLVIVAGTGSVVAGRNPEGEEYRTLGLGPTFGDSGSASEVSEAGVSAVAAAFLKKGPATRLTDVLCEHTGCGSVVEFIEATSRGRIDGSTFAPLVFHAANEGDEVASRIVSEAGERLGENAVHVLRALRMQDVAFEVVLAGGLFRSGSRLPVDAIERVVRPVAPDTQLVLLNAPPVVGAVLLAIELAGEKVPPGVHAMLAGATAAALGRRTGGSAG